MALSRFQADLMERARQERDIDESLGRSAQGAQVAADGIFRGFQADINERLQKIKDDRHAIDIGGRIAAATAKDVELENQAARQAEFDRVHSELQMIRQQDIESNERFAAAAAAAQEQRDTIFMQAQKLGLTPSNLEDGGSETTQAPLPTSIASPAQTKTVAPPKTGSKLLDSSMGVLDRLGLVPRKTVRATEVPTAQPEDQLAEFTLRAPDGFGFDKNGNLVIDLDGSESPTFEVSEFDRPTSERLMTDEEINRAAMEAASKVGIMDVRSEVVRRMRAEPGNDFLFESLGEAGVKSLYDDYTSEQSAAKAKADKEAFDRTIESRKAQRKDKELAFDVNKGTSQMLVNLGELFIKSEDSKTKRMDAETRRAKERARARGASATGLTVKLKGPYKLASQSLEKKIADVTRSLRGAKQKGAQKESETFIKGKPSDKNNPRVQVVENFKRDTLGSVFEDDPHAKAIKYFLENDMIGDYRHNVSVYLSRAQQEGKSSGWAEQEARKATANQIKAAPKGENPASLAPKGQPKPKPAETVAAETDQQRVNTFLDQHAPKFPKYMQAVADVSPQTHARYKQVFNKIVSNTLESKKGLSHAELEEAKAEAFQEAAREVLIIMVQEGFIKSE